MGLTVQAQLLGALQKGGIVPEPLQGQGAPFPPPSSHPSPWPQGGAAPPRTVWCLHQMLCAGAVSDQPLAQHRQTWLMIYAQLHHLISIDIRGCGVKLGKKALCMQDSPGVCTGKTREQPGQPSNWNSPQEMQKG